MNATVLDLDGKQNSYSPVNILVVGDEEMSQGSNLVARPTSDNSEGAMNVRFLIGELDRVVTRTTDLQAAVADTLKHLHGWFGTHISMMFVPRSAQPVPAMRILGAPENRLELYLHGDLGRAGDPLMHVVEQWCAPMHSNSMLVASQWQQSEFRQAHLREYQIDHYLAMPLLLDKNTMATIHLGRRVGQAPYDERDVANATALGMHLSVFFAAHRVSTVGQLAYREAQVAMRAARGDDNVRIAVELGIARETVKKTLGRVYAKLGVANRTQLATLLAQRS